MVTLLLVCGRSPKPAASTTIRRFDAGPPEPVEGVRGLRRRIAERTVMPKVGCSQMPMSGREETQRREGWVMVQATKSWSTSGTGMAVGIRTGARAA